MSSNSSNKKIHLDVEQTQEMVSGSQISCGGQKGTSAPLSQLCRPKSIQDFVGQDHLLDEYGSIKLSIQLKWLTSMIFYGPPSVGKTTIANLVANESGYVFCEFSATDSSIKDIEELRLVIKEENFRRRYTREPALKVVIFIDEVHRFSKTQQDFLLPYVESGEMVFFGATTMNPTSRLRSALISRCQVHQLFPLSVSQVNVVLRRALGIENLRRRRAGLFEISLDSSCMQLIVQSTIGDTRKAINLIEIVSRSLIPNDMGDEVTHSPHVLSKEHLQRIMNLFESSNFGLRHRDNAVLFSIFFDSLRRVYREKKVESYFKHRSRIIQKLEEKRSRDKKKDNEMPIKSSVKVYEQSDRTLKVSIKLKHRRSMRHNQSKDSLEPKSDCPSVQPWSRNIASPPDMERTGDEGSLHSDRDSDFESFYDEFRSSSVQDNDPMFEWKSQIRNMDVNQNEATSIYSDDENESGQLTYYLDNVTDETYFRVASIYFALLLLKKGESSLYIAKQILIFASLYLDTNCSFFTKLLGYVKTMRTSSTDTKVLLSNCIGLLFKQNLKNEKHLKFQSTRFKMLKRFWANRFQDLTSSATSASAVLEQLSPVYDPETVDNDHEYTFDEKHDVSDEEESSLGLDIRIQDIDDLDLENDIIRGSEYLLI